MPTTLAEYHDRIEAMMADGDALIAARDPATAGTAKRRCGDAALIITSYQLHVHREVFPRMLASEDAAVRAAAADLKTECIGLAEDLRFRVKDLMAQETALDWDALAQGVAWFNARVRTHIANVERAIAPMTHADRVRFRAERSVAVGRQAA